MFHACSRARATLSGAEPWIGVAYEIFRALKARRLLVDDAFNGIA
jgi:hypothetical protein